MKYKSSLTKPITFAIIILLLFWVVNFWVIINSNDMKDAIVFSALMFGFLIVFVSVLVKGIYVIIENNSVKYVHMFVLRKAVEIAKINKIQKSLIGGFYNSLSLIYEENGKIKDIKIITLTFRKDILKKFVSDLKIQNPGMVIDQSVNEFISK